METLRDLIQVCLDSHVPLVLLVSGVILIVIDYLFDTDIPAHVGYACFALMAFLLTVAPILGSLLVALGVFVLLELFHFLWFRRILAIEPPAGDEPESPQEPRQAPS